MASRRIITFLVIILSALACLVFVFCYLPHGNSIGAADYIQYYSALRIALSGLNPYDPEIMRAMQISLGKPENATVMSWNPPWTYLVLAPFCLLPFVYAVPLWLLCNLFFLIHNIVLCHKTYCNNSNVSTRKLILCSFYFLPTFSCIAFGQTGLLMSWIICLFLYSCKNQKFFVAGILLSLLSIKPHLYYLLVPLILYWSFTEKNYRLLSGIVLGFLVLLLTTFLLAPATLKFWLAAIFSPTKISGAQTILDWKVATLVGIIKTIADEVWFVVPNWPMWFVPLCTAGVFLYYLLTKKPKLSLIYTLPPLLAVSLFTSPYGWFFDQSILLCLHVFLMLRALELKNRKLISVLFALQALLLVQRTLQFHAQHHYFWFPLALLIVWRIATETTQSVQ